MILSNIKPEFKTNEDFSSRILMYIVHNTPSNLSVFFGFYRIHITSAIFATIFVADNLKNEVIHRYSMSSVLCSI